MIYDLTHLIAPGMPVYPGTAAPTLTPAGTMEDDGFRETMLTMTSHTGTHMDAPSHMLVDGSSLDQLEISHFGGRAIVIDCSDLRGKSITMNLLMSYQRELETADFVLFRTGFESRWGSEEYFGDFAVPDQRAMWMLTELGLKGIGTDACSIDPMSDTDFPNHKAMFAANMVSIENLRLAELPAGRLFPFYALPMHYLHADGAPVRAIAVL